MSEDAVATWTAAMRRGDFAAAWSVAHAFRAAADLRGRDDPALPYHRRWVWDGTPLDRRDVLVRCYHGLGDTLQFARFLPSLVARAASVTLEVQPSLIPLLAPVTRGMTVRPFDPARPLPSAEDMVEITELGEALALTPRDTPAPYLTSPGDPLPMGTIGLCHRAGEWDDERSLPAALFAPIAATHPAVTLVAEPSALPVLNPAGCPFDMLATARLVQGCALVITVDTMIAHLAGALGRPTWLLLKADPDWRWTPGARDTCWYPTTRLYHQRTAGDWRSLLPQVEHDLATAIPAAA